MTMDFSQEAEQREKKYGPVPAGSIVIVEMETLLPHSQAPENPYISVAKSGLRQLYCQFTVKEGEYEGVLWRESITLPASMQKESLTQGQQTACRIGGATLKAILEAARRSLRIQDAREFTGLKFPVKVRINNRPVVKQNDDGEERVYWNNEIDRVITPKMDEHEKARREREIINPNGAVTGKSEAEKKQPGQQAAQQGKPTIPGTASNSWLINDAPQPSSMDKTIFDDHNVF